MFVRKYARYFRGSLPSLARMALSYRKGRSERINHDDLGILVIFTHENNSKHNNKAIRNIVGTQTVGQTKPHLPLCIEVTRFIRNNPSEWVLARSETGFHEKLLRAQHRVLL